MHWIKGGPARFLAAVLLAQSVAYYAAAYRKEEIPAVAPLSDFPRTAGSWTVAREYPIDKEVEAVLRADDTMNRAYVDSATRATASLFVAFFKTQRFGQAPHSPKNCLPGAGWEPLEDTRLTVEVPGRAEPITINKYTVAHGDAQSIVLYWYQSHGRVIAGEIPAKFWLVSDAIRYRRTDTALVRIVVPVVADGRAAAEDNAVRFLKTVFPEVAQTLPR